MKQWAKDFTWFIKESYKYCAGLRGLYFWTMLVPKAVKFASGGYNAD